MLTKRFITFLLLVLSGLQLMARTVKHPSLLYTDALVSQAKQNMKTDANYQRAWGDLQARADRCLEGNHYKELDLLAMVYRMTGDSRYADAIKRNLKSITAMPTWGSSEMLVRKPVWTADLGHADKCFRTAMAFDAVYSVLTKGERQQIAKDLYRLGVEPAMHDWVEDPYRIHALNSMGHNWWTSCACAGGILAVALQNEIPQASKDVDAVAQAVPQWFGFEGDVLQNKPRTCDRAGGMYESVNYANFGISEALKFMVVLRNAVPDVKMADIPEMKGIVNFFTQLSYPNTNGGGLMSVCFGDGNLHVTGENSLIYLWALGHKDPNILWYLSQLKEGQNREGHFLNTPIGFLYMPSLKGHAAEPKASLTQLWEDFGWATLRSSWKPDATLLAVKSGYTWNHSHADANSFQIFHHGQPIIIDPENSWYGSPEYRGYFFQSQSHNVVLFNNQGQPTEQQYHGAPLRGYLHHLMDAGSMKYLLADGTGPMSRWLSRNYRHFLWMDKLLLVIDDLKSHEPGEYSWLWHFYGEMKKNQYRMDVTQGDAAISVMPLYPALMIPSAFEHDYPDMAPLREHEAPTKSLKEKTKYYQLHLPGQRTQVKAVNAIFLKDSPTDKDLPQVERREGTDWIGLRITWHGQVTDLYINQQADGRLMHRNSWIEADGWQTDAYMWAVTYKEGQPAASARDLFVAYGSALRRGTDSYFSSLSKLFVIKKNGKVMVEGTSKPIYKIK